MFNNAHNHGVVFIFGQKPRNKSHFKPKQFKPTCNKGTAYMGLHVCCIYMQSENRYEFSTKSPITSSAISREPITFFLDLNNSTPL